MFGRLQYSSEPDQTDPWEGLLIRQIYPENEKVLNSIIKEIAILCHLNFSQCTESKGRNGEYYQCNVASV